MAESHRQALVVSSSRYAEPSLQPLTAPAEDADALAAVLRDPDFGGFRVREIIDQPSWVVAEEVERFFVERNLDDVALFYFSGHGIKDDDGALYFAAMNTKRRFLRSTAVPSDHMVAAMRRCRSRQQVLLLDCCYAGAFSRAMVTKGDERVGVQERFATEGAGRVVITASDAMQYAFEGEQLRGEAPLSIFTRTLVEGIRTGEADEDHDGRVSLDELYDYVYEHVRLINPSQTPTISNIDKRGEIVIALNPHAALSVREEATPKPKRKPIDKPAAGRKTRPARSRGGSAAKTAPELDAAKDSRQQQRKVLDELGEAEDIKASEVNKKLVDLLLQHLKADEQLLGACRITTGTFASGFAGVLAVTPRRVVWAHAGSPPEVRELPYKHIVAARAERDALFWRKLVVWASPKKFQFGGVTPPERADALAAVINERAAGKR